MPLNDDDMEVMTALLQNKTHMGRFNQAEVADVLRFLESQGADLQPELVPDPVITIPRSEFAPEPETPFIQWPESDGNETHCE